MPVYICYQFCGWLSSFCGGLFIVCGVFVYVGAINRSPTAANRLPKHCWQIGIMRGEHSANYLRSPTKYDANTPWGVGADSSCPYISVINSAGIWHHFVGVYSLYVGARVPFRGSFGICGRDKSVPYSCEQIAITLLTDWNNACRTGRKLSTFAHEIRCEHTVRRRGRFIVPVYFCYQFCGYLTSFCGCIFIICGGACAISWEFWYMRAR